MLGQHFFTDGCSSSLPLHRFGERRHMVFLKGDSQILPPLRQEEPDHLFVQSDDGDTRITQIRQDSSLMLKSDLVIFHIDLRTLRLPVDARDVIGRKLNGLKRNGNKEDGREDGDCQCCL